MAKTRPKKTPPRTDSTTQERAGVGGDPSKKHQAAMEAMRTKLESEITAKLKQLERIRKSSVYPFFNESIDTQTVDDVYDDIRKKVDRQNKRLDVIVQSDGGDIHAAFNLGLLFRRYAKDNLAFIVPRWAKSAATLLVCSGNEVLLGPISEIGPVDPQITTMNPMEGRLEQFSPLYINATLELIRSEFRDGSEDLAKGLLHRLQFPLTLGGYTRSLELGEGYIRKLLSTRMFASLDSDEKMKLANKVAHTLVRSYEDHGYCIEAIEATAMGLNVKEMNGKILDLVWDVFRLNEKVQAIKKAEQKLEMGDLLRTIEPGRVPKPQRDKKHDAPNLTTTR